MIRLLTLVAILASSAGCRSASTARDVPGLAGPDASASTVSEVHGAVGPDAEADPNTELRAYVRADPQLATGEYIDYRGEAIKLTKRYDDWDTFKNDPNNIAPAEYARVRQLIEAAPVPEHCADFQEILQAEFDLEFPGYGSGGIGDWHATDKKRVVGVSIAIPHADANRYIIYLRDDRGYRLVDDAVLPETPYIREVTVSDGKVTYRTREGAIVVERPIRASH